ncbi:hypothetical protein LSH36_139g05089 [Paralvinella palmiformis]|uniref:Amyloid protein-binding protein 2 n=1 Tax=Paralvinella palmiformis TaxID=53620 RepID=A0AAD9JX77_9ANNE|nr:hypothetical protein LSH36_139g05089 [Paralvinella palmiformis]
MAEACALEWAPGSLYNTAISTIVTHYAKYWRHVKGLPENVQFDVYYKLYNKGRLCDLSTEFSDLDTFAKVLRVKDKRHLLHHCFQAVMDHCQCITNNLADIFCQRCSCLTQTDDPVPRQRLIQLGFSLGGFLSEAGWFFAAEKVFLSSLEICQQGIDCRSLIQALECCVQLLHVRIVNCQFSGAEQAWQVAHTILLSLEKYNTVASKACLYSEYSQLLFAKSHYDAAYDYCCRALKEVHLSLPPRVIVDVFRQSAKACVVKRKIKKAELLIKFSVQYAREHFGPKHPKLSDALMDYGFYLLNADAVSQAVVVYQAALDIRIGAFGGNNLHVALGYEDLAYSTYVHEYSTGKFQDAKEHAEKAIKIIRHILPPDHLLLASSNRVIALILEEIAIDSHDKDEEYRLLREAEELHLASLALAKEAFGENNEAERMHKKAISIKNDLLGPEDYEVGLSVGHLASLYNYDMNQYEEAERLYLQSIAIGLKLFGQGYSGLEYDYRGLLRLYQSTANVQKAIEYGTILHQWNQMRDHSNAEECKPLDFSLLENCEQVVEKFYTMDS